MLFFLSAAKNSYGWVEYDHDHSMGYEFFLECATLKDLEGKVPIRFRVTKKSAVAQVLKCHLIESTGPTLVSKAFRSLLEQGARSQVEFLSASVEFEGQELEGFSSVHPLTNVECIDLERSEYEITNFDPNDPHYSFLYMCMRENLGFEPQIARCTEFRNQLVVNDKVKDACFAAKLRGLAFYRAIDLTYNNRTVGQKI
jgi:hypothetical protein